MTIHAPASIAHPATNATDGRLGRIGGAAALLAAGTFGYGIAMFATSLADYTDPDATPAESVDSLDRCYVAAGAASMLAATLVMIRRSSAISSAVRMAPMC